MKPWVIYLGAKYMGRCLARTKNDAFVLAELWWGVGNKYNVEPAKKTDLQMRPAHICSCCLQPRNEEKSKSDCFIAHMFGHVRYALCPTCLQEVPRDAWDDEYKKRYDDACREINETFS